MTTWAAIWWVWLTAGLVLAVVEVLAPGFIFLGFAIGAVLMSVIVALLPQTMAFAIAMSLFGGLSLLAWIGLRIAFRNQRSGARFIKHDIND